MFAFTVTATATGSPLLKTSVPSGGGTLTTTIFGGGGTVTGGSGGATGVVVNGGTVVVVVGVGVVVVGGVDGVLGADGVGVVVVGVVVVCAGGVDGCGFEITTDETGVEIRLAGFGVVTCARGCCVATGAACTAA